MIKFIIMYTLVLSIIVVIILLLTKKLTCVIKNKKLLFILIGVVLVLGVVLGKIDYSLKRNAVAKVKYTNLEQALDGYYTRINNSQDEEMKESLTKELEEFVLKDFQGYYYYHENNSYNGSDYMRKHYPLRFTDEKDQRVIYVKNNDEVYIFPFSEDYLKENNIKLENLDKIENSNLYKYKITNIETSDQDGAYNKYKSATITLESYYVNENMSDADTNYTTIEFSYFTSDNYYNITGFFADMISDEDDVTKNVDNLSSGISSYRHYYRTFELSEQANQKQLEEYLSEKQQENAIKNSIPKVGMTSSEVRKTKWGNPDKINKDTYSWGTHEQWVYNDYGYVYFKNGVVSSVSER